MGVCPGEGCLPAVNGMTGVKTLPCHNYVADGNKPLQCFDVTPLTQSVDTPQPLVAQDSASVSQKTFRSSTRRWRTHLTLQGPSSPRCRLQKYYKTTSMSEEVSTQVVTSRFRKELEDISPFLWGNWYICFELLVTSGWINLLVCFLACVQWNPQIWLLPIGSQHGSPAVPIHILASKHWRGSSLAYTMPLPHSLRQGRCSTNYAMLPRQLDLLSVIDKSSYMDITLLPDISINCLQSYSRVSICQVFEIKEGHLVDVSTRQIIRHSCREKTQLILWYWILPQFPSLVFLFLRVQDYFNWIQPCILHSAKCKISATISN